MSIPIACSLDVAARPRRLADWQKVTTHVQSREPIEGGVRLVLGRGAPVGSIAELAAAEQSCCSFFAFAVTLDGRGAALEVRAPVEGLTMIEELFSPPRTP